MRDLEIPDEWIEELVRYFGLTEDEAYVFACLTEARDAYYQLPEARFDDAAFRTSIDIASKVLAMRVVKRDHPDGWLTNEEREERGVD
jgi:hypothetical protein